MATANKPLVIVLDNNASDRAFVKFYLDRNGYRTLLAHDWSEARLLLEYLNPDLFIVNALLPDQNALQICQNIRDHHRDDELQILLLMEVDRDPSAAKQAQQVARANAVLQKPLDQWALIHVVKELIGGSLQPISEEKTTEPVNYEMSRKAYVHLLSCFDVSAKQCLKLLAYHNTMLPWQWSSLFGNFLAHSRNSLKSVDLDQDYCSQAVSKITSDILRAHKVALTY